MGDFDFGNTLLDRATGTLTTGMCIDRLVDAPSDGVITGLGVTISAQGTCVIYIVEPLTNGCFRVRSSYDCGTLTVGEHQFLGLSLNVKAGDCLAWSGGCYVEATTDAGSYCVNGGGMGLPMADDDYFYAGTNVGKIHSLHAWADYTSLAAPAQEIYDEIVRMRSEDYEGAATWLRANWDWEPGDLLLAHIARTNLTAGGATGGGVTLAQLQAELDTRFGVTAVDLSESIADIRDEIGVKNAPATGLLAALETHDGNIDVAVGAVHDDLEAVDLHVTSIIPAVCGDPATSNKQIVDYVDGRADAIDTAIAAIDALTSAEVTTIVNAARDHIEGSPAHDLKGISDEIAAIPQYDDTTVVNAISNLDGDVADLHTDVADVHTDVNALVIPAAESNLYPGSAEVTPSAPVAFGGPIEITRAMDGVYVEIDSEPAGTGKDECSDHKNWRHAGWLAFLADGVYGDEIQWLGLDAAVYVPKRLLHATGCLVFPRTNSSGTITPFTRSA